MATIKTFEDLDSWKLARKMTQMIYDISDRGRFRRDYALKDQIRRSAISVVSNIAEGFERSGNREFVNFLSIAKGSCGEARAQMYVALDQGYVTKREFAEIVSLLKKTSKLIYGLMRYLNESDHKGFKYQR